MPEYGPFATERDAWATEACAAERAAWRVPGDGEKFNMQMLLDGIAELGVDLGAYDLSPLRQVAMYETSKCVALRGIIRRAYEAGKAAGPDAAVTEWGVRLTSVGGHNQVIREASKEVARNYAATTPLASDPQWFVRVVRRNIGPWEVAPDA